ncbi:MAG: hypothetical protein Q8K93_25925 [Reyranella sp.]|nr:hypothetical protein [Reyranella sp.]
MRLLRTYIFKLHTLKGTVDRRPVLCGSNADALTKAQQWLDDHPDVDVIEVLCGGEDLFQVGRPA